jgi:phosphohistidine phosphatase SixA
MQLNELKPVPENVLLVGHEPYLSRLIGRLISGNATAGIELKKGGLGKLEMAALRFGRCATLAWLLTPTNGDVKRVHASASVGQTGKA